MAKEERQGGADKESASLLRGHINKHSLPRCIGLQKSVERMGVRSIHIQLRKDGKLCAFALSKSENLFVHPRPLPPKLIA